MISLSGRRKGGMVHVGHIISANLHAEKQCLAPRRVYRESRCMTRSNEVPTWTDE